MDGLINLAVTAQGELYLNGRPIGKRTFAGSPKNWDKNYRLALGNELSNDRPWLGTFHEVAIYPAALTASVLGEAGPADRYLISSFNPDTLAAVVRAYPGVRTGWLADVGMGHTER